MEQISKGGEVNLVSQRDIVLLSFPFSDLQTSKVRPAIVISNDRHNRRSEDFVAVPLTSNLKYRDYAILVTNEALEKGNLIVDSKAKVDRIFSVSERLVRMNIGRVKKELHESIVSTLLELLHDSSGS